MQRIKGSLILAVAVLGLTDIARAEDRFGAISYSPKTGTYGFSYAHPSQADAEAGALAECRARADDCGTPVWFRNACGAVAAGKDGGWGTDWGNDRQSAEANALNMCGRYTTDCSVLRSVCATAP